MDVSMQGSSSLFRTFSKPIHTVETEKKLPMFLEKPEYRQFEDQNDEVDEDLTAMYAEMILRNKRFKPSFPLRE